MLINVAIEEKDENGYFSRWHLGDKLPKLTANEAEELLPQNGFMIDRQKGC